MHVPSNTDRSGDEGVNLRALVECKRDILLEAAEDVWQLYHVPGQLIEEWEVPQEDAVGTGLALAQELIDLGLVITATWAEEGDALYRHVAMDDEALRRALAPTGADLARERFLVATPKGKDWAKRYNALMGALSGPRDGLTPEPAGRGRAARTRVPDYCKRQLLDEATATVWHLCHAPILVEESREVPAAHAVQAALTMVGEVMALGLAFVAEWAVESDPPWQQVSLSRAKMRRALDPTETDFAFEYFLVLTPKGQDWVRREDALLGELSRAVG